MAFLFKLIPLRSVFMKIVNKGGNEPSSSYSATAARYRSSSSGRSSSLRSASLSARRLSSHVGASSSKAASDAGQALLNINKLKEKVASHGSRVMASFKTEGGGASASNAASYGSSTTSKASGSSSKVSSSTATSEQHSDKSSSISKLNTQSSLTNEQLTAHLSAEERNILEKVFLKEEEFHRESVFKRYAYI